MNRESGKARLSLRIAMGIQRSIVEFGNILIQAAINSLGAVTIAAVSAAQRVRGFNMMPVFALSRSVVSLFLSDNAKAVALAARYILITGVAFSKLQFLKKLP
ncbi:MAG: hypothetical protein FWC21_07010 [Treponema sp.]|nr:hypothetical protein [Treponema sp.]